VFGYHRLKAHKQRTLTPRPFVRAQPTPSQPDTTEQRSPPQASTRDHRSPTRPGIRQNLFGVEHAQNENEAGDDVTRQNGAREQSDRSHRKVGPASPVPEHREETETNHPNSRSYRGHLQPIGTPSAPSSEPLPPIGGAWSNMAEDRIEPPTYSSISHAPGARNEPPPSYEEAISSSPLDRTTNNSQSRSAHYKELDLD